MRKKKKANQTTNKYKVKPYEITEKRNTTAKGTISAWINSNKVTIAIIFGLIAVMGIFFVVELVKPKASEGMAALNQKTKQQAQNTESMDTASNNSEQPHQECIPEYLKAYLKINKCTIGYIKIEDTKVDYPVVQTDNNVYYLTHNFRFEEDNAGAIFMDYRCDAYDFSKTRNIILYGHRMKAGTMFKELLKYEDRNFFAEHPIIQFDTLSGEYQWKIFAVLKTTTDFYYIDTEFPYDEMWLDFLEQVRSRSLYDTHVNFYPDDIVLTLSTCTMEDDGRFVVLAKLIR